ncbi:hypothetical protein NW762_004138 [Fusarium torreyae]|uniref:Uncharacterized protein n=1 Tax=Fusarium torreyae TaxID=1237075 RepID=A0A9W8S782_9HYPO|nr:hypothetical protein NW762_004138 [Fusarium torreyae]
MHSTIFALVAITGLAMAKPTEKPQAECKGSGSYYVCASNGFRGHCSVDACNYDWCPDFEYKTCDPVSTTEPTDDSEGHWEPKPEDEGLEPESMTPAKKLPEGQCAPGTGFFQVCSNGFKGYCKGDACGNNGCPDSEHSKRGSDPTVCAPGTGFFQSCSNGFRGCCKSDACSGKSPVCPDAKTVKARNDDPTVCAPGTGFFQSCSNGFRGCCKKDACSGNSPICPDNKATNDETKKADPKETWTPHLEAETTETTKPKTSSNLPEGQCAEGTGFFQVCANGFKGCCKSDACSGSAPVCPDTKTVKARNTDPTVCPQGTGFFQSCSNGFRGCCKGDACGNTWCPDYKTGTYEPAKTMKVKVRSSDPTVCAPGTGFFQSCSNGFRGCCKKDACGQKLPVCPQ